MRSLEYNKVLNSESSFLFLALSVLESRGHSGLSALISVIGANNFLKLVRLYSGGNIKVPTGRELSQSIVAALYIYHKYAESLPEDVFLKKYDVDMNIKVLHTIVEKWEDYAEKQGINIKVLLNSVMDV